MMDFTITEYQAEDLENVVAFNRKITNKWFHYKIINGKLVQLEEDSIENLSNFEQWYHGGPWNNPVMLQLYVKLVEQCQGKIYLAWNEHHELVGEIDCCVANNYENRGYILWILTHPNYRRHGIGRLLINHCVAFFKQKSFDSIIVIPEDNNAAAFYYNVGFIPYKKRFHVEISTTNPTPWNQIVKKYRITPVFSNELAMIDMLSMYPLIGSTESNNYIVQTVLNREKIIEILGANIVHDRFLPTLWKLKMKSNVAIFGTVYQFRVWVNLYAAKDEKFLQKLKLCIESFYTQTEQSESLNFFILDRDSEVIINWDHTVLKEEHVLLLQCN